MALQPKYDTCPSTASSPLAHPPATGQTDKFFKSDNNTLQQFLAEGKKHRFILTYGEIDVEFLGKSRSFAPSEEIPSYATAN